MDTNFRVVTNSCCDLQWNVPGRYHGYYICSMYYAMIFNQNTANSGQILLITETLESSIGNSVFEVCGYPHSVSPSLP